MLVSVGLACGMPDHCERKLRREYSRLVADLEDEAAQQNAILALREMRSAVVSPVAEWSGQAPDPKCPLELQHSGTVSQRATCPWVEQRLFVAARYPQILVDVKCICDRCLGKNTNKEACLKVEHEIPVFYLTDKNECQYEVSTAVVATGCTCAGEFIHHAESRLEALQGPTHHTTTKRSVDGVLEKAREWKRQRDQRNRKKNRKRGRKAKARTEKVRRSEKQKEKKKAPSQPKLGPFLSSFSFDVSPTR